MVFYLQKKRAITFLQQPRMKKKIYVKKGGALCCLLLYGEVVSKLCPCDKEILKKSKYFLQSQEIPCLYAGISHSAGKARLPYGWRAQSAAAAKPGLFFRKSGWKTYFFRRFHPPGGRHLSGIGELLLPDCFQSFRDFPHRLHHILSASEEFPEQ